MRAANRLPGETITLARSRGTWPERQSQQLDRIHRIETHRCEVDESHSQEGAGLGVLRPWSIRSEKVLTSTSRSPRARSWSFSAGLRLGRNIRHHRKSALERVDPPHRRNGRDDPHERLFEQGLALFDRGVSEPSVEAEPSCRSKSQDDPGCWRQPTRTRRVGGNVPSV
jgi:hypothetical protein